MPVSERWKGTREETAKRLAIWHFWARSMQLRTVDRCGVKGLGVIPRSKELVDAIENPKETNRFVSLRNIRNFEAEIKMPT